MQNPFRYFNRDSPAIEKKNDMDKLAKLKSVIKPFILRRLKGQVATELPEKIENIQYCIMTDEQEQDRRQPFPLT